MSYTPGDLSKSKSSINDVVLSLYEVLNLSPVKTTGTEPSDTMRSFEKNRIT